MISWNQNITEVQIYRDYIKFTVAKDWRVSNNVIMDDVNHQCSVELRDRYVRKKKTVLEFGK